MQQLNYKMDHTYFTDIFGFKATHHDYVWVFVHNILYIFTASGNKYMDKILWSAVTNKMHAGKN